MTEATGLPVALPAPGPGRLPAALLLWARSVAGLVARVLAPALLRWRRSLQMRVAVTTLILSTVVVALLGVTLLNVVTHGLLTDKTRSALSELRTGTQTVQSQLLAAESANSATVTAAAQQAAQDLGQIGQSAADSFAVQLSSSESNGFRFGGIDSGIPNRLRRVVAGGSGQEAYTYTELQYADGTAVPGLVVGAQIAIPAAGGYQLYYSFPLGQEAQTVQLVRSTLLFVGLALVLLLVAIAAIVTRQVVTPVRLAARTAERLAAGRLEERMAVRGQDDLARLATSFNRMAANLQSQIRRLENLSRLQRRFVADVSHELRTPLTTVRMAADVLHAERSGFPGEAGRAAELLQTQLDRFETLLADLLEISRHDAGAAILDSEPVDLRGLLERLAENADPLAQRRGCKLRLRLPDSPVIAEIDTRRIERVLRNLVTNAIEHGDGGDVEIELAGSATAAAILVADHGAGLNPGESSLVFNRFWRGDPSRARTTGGSGLGLAIALEDARLHGGWLQAWGEPGRGSRFRLSLPRRAGDVLRVSPLPLIADDVEGAAPADPRATAPPVAGWPGA
ncbi:MAG TPA: MtrAB system histidine kinase MtrB [Mycobacteriales bacterium]|nr:MtrAB system histidine kinase MtrB [Mycobacteriales bacterium]